MTTTLLFYLEQVARIKAKIWAISYQEDQMTKRIQDNLAEQIKLQDELFLWEKEIMKIRAFDKANSPMKQSDQEWTVLKVISEVLNRPS